MNRLSILGFLLTLSSFGAEQVFVPAPPQLEAPDVVFQIPYTAGVHRGNSTNISGLLRLSASNQLVFGKFVVALKDLTTKNPTRDCHMREAMGIDYTHSSFPGLHVCDSNNETPLSGPDSIAYPNLEFEFTGLQLISGESLPEKLELGKTYDVRLPGRFAIHGQSRILEGGDANPSLIGKLEVVAGEIFQLRLMSSFQVSLKDYGIIVKPSKTGPVTISVADKATVNLNLRLVRSE